MSSADCSSWRRPAPPPPAGSNGGQGSTTDDLRHRAPVFPTLPSRCATGESLLLYPLKRAARWAVLALATVLLQACATPPRLPPPPQSLETKALAIGLPNARFYADEQISEMLEEGLRALDREMAAKGIASRDDLPAANYLALSGGGEDGAFGAGFLVGWGEAGTRPEFKLVTGVSTGALIAPFAFLGEEYDSQLSGLYTQLSAKDVFLFRPLLTGLFEDALLDTTPLFSLIRRHLDEEMLTSIATEYRKGRMLLIGTTNLDAQRPVLWNIGAIADSGHPDALDLVRRILLASAAIPAAFPPVMIDVELDGETFQEMHVDQGVIAQVFLYPPALANEIRPAGLLRERRAFIIRNGKLGSDWMSVNRSTLDVAERSIDTMIQMSSVNDLFRLYYITQSHGADYNLALIEEDFIAPPHEEEFDPTYMNALYDYGFEKGRNGYSWKKVPPLLKGPRSSGLHR